MKIQLSVKEMDEIYKQIREGKVKELENSIIGHLHGLMWLT